MLFFNNEMKRSYMVPGQNTGCWLMLLVLMLFSLPLMAEDKDVNLTASATAKGKPPQVLFQKYCSICHGDNGNGKSRVIKSMNPPPRDFTTPQAAQELSRERMIVSIAEGRPGTAMVSHKRKLSDAEIASIVDYIRSTFMQLPENKNFSKSSAVPSTASSTVPSTTPAHQPATQMAQSSPEAATAKSTTNTQSKQHSHGRDLFKKNCASCHGDRGNTAIWARSGLNPPPRDFTSAQASADLTRERMVNSVTNGRPGTAMMSFSTRLSGDDIEAVVSFIRSEFMKINDGPLAKAPAAGGNAPADSDPHRGPHDRGQSASASSPPAMSPPDMNMAGPADMSKAMPGGLKSDVNWGEEFYLKNCFVCHGKKGDGKGPRSHFITPRPRNFTSKESRRSYNRPRLFEAIKKGKRGTVMPAWGTVLSDQQIANVAEYVFKTFIAGDVAVDKKAGLDDQPGKKKASLMVSQ